MKELVIFDIDGTIVRGQSQRLFLKYLLSVHKIKLSFYLKLMMWFVLYKLGLVKDPKKPMEYAFSFLKGKSVEEIASLAHEFFEKVLKENIYSDVLDIIKEHRSLGREVMLVSNAAEPIVKELALYLNVTQYICTTLEIEDGFYTGKIGDTVYGEHKTDMIEQFFKIHDWNLNTAWAYGDHLSDQSLLSIVKHPVATNPSSSLSKIAHKKHWPILVFK
jgi:HAD superfamily hydrolase (TIGR01490 family)